LAVGQILRYESAIDQISLVSVVSARSFKVSARWVVGLVVRPSLSGFDRLSLGLGQFDQVSVRLSRSRLCPYRYNIYITLTLAMYRNFLKILYLNANIIIINILHILD